MPTSTYIPIATYTLSSSASSITFSGIPQSYGDLVVACTLRSDRSATNDPIKVRFNGDSTTGNYLRIALYGNGSSPAKYVDAPGELIVDAGATGASSTSGAYSTFNFSVFDYSKTNKHKTVITESDVADTETRRQAARWASTSAINSISVSPYFGTNLVSGSTITIFGIAV